jgi:mRNA interferase MazF
MIGNRPTLIARGRTYWVEFRPSRGHEQDGLRPAIVVSAEEMSAAGILTVVPTTRQKLDRIRPYEVLIPAGRGVPFDSKALCNHIQTIDIAERVRDPIGVVDDDLMDEVDRAILIVLFGDRAA